MLVALAILHTVFGYLMLGVASDEEMQETCFYRYDSPLIGHVHKYVVYGAAWSLVVCAPLLAISYKLSVAAAWASIVLYLSTAVVSAAGEGKWPTFCKGCAISVGLRVLAAASFTALAWSRAGG